MASRTGTGRCAALLLTAAVATGSLTGCQTVADAATAKGCEGTESRVEELKSYGVLGSRPQGTVVPKGFEELDAGCWEDSGEAWVYAERTYVFPGDRTEVTRHYRVAAQRDGWKLSPDSRQSPKEEQTASLCFTLGKGDDATVLDVYFLTEEILDAEERKTGPEFSSGAGYRVAVTSTADGSANSCSD
ncbi:MULTISPECIES: hypothetical protein [unclassified Streptomyces]|uniref:hypothetical protein n=1 Tax=unclassified Streptomyces TaxID=2593676 RepID=UPI0009398C49|nr:hypothetical protein [Streptomyces sp. TSRI0281]